MNVVLFPLQKSLRRLAAVVWCVALLAGGSACVYAEDLSDGVLQIHFDPADRAVAQQAAAVLQAALQRLGPHLPPGDAPIHVVICHTVDEFRRYAGRYRASMVAGVAHPEEGIIAVKEPSLLNPDTDYAGVLRHELVHVLLARNTDPDNMPRWFNEGVAMVAAGEYQWQSSVRLVRMYVGGGLIPYATLNISFQEPGTEREFDDAYAEAVAMTRFLRDKLGEDAFWQLVRSLQTQSFGAALQQYTGWTPLEYWQAWKRSLWKLALLTFVVSGFSVFQLMLIAAIIAFLHKRRRTKALMREWAEEEAVEGYPSGPPEAFDEEPWQDPWDDDDDDRW